VSARPVDIRTALARYATDAVAFIDDQLTRNEKGQPWRLSRHQRRVLARALRRDPSGRLLFRLVLWGEMKKSGKTLLAAALVLWWAFITPYTEIIIAANDLEQSVGRVFQTVVALLKMNPALLASAVVRATSITVSNGTVLTAIASDYRGAAGSRHSLAVFDELWGYQLENATRLYEELTPPPTEPDAWLLVVTTAGFTGESKLLEDMYQRGLAGTRVDAELECYETDELFMFWSHTPRQPWQTGEAGARYYAEQRRILRPATYDRLHGNRWGSPESRFITDALWDACIDPTHRPLLGRRPAVRLYVGVDASTKHDSSAVVSVYWDGDRLALAGHRIWQPSPTAPLDLEASIEAHLRELAARFDVARMRCDPYQRHRSITTLQAAGLPIEEFPQTAGNTTRMGQVLFDLLTGRNVRLYPADDLRAQALHTVAVEGVRGFRLAKEKATRKIDAVVALAIAATAAIDEQATGGSAMMVPIVAGRLRTDWTAEQCAAYFDRVAFEAAYPTRAQLGQATG
jgi:phage terminase large subunit-like protein